ncbi:MAG: NAD-dependent DNA ligase LigA [Spirochaetales bacterium]|nr:NAD-dependent DNA ligase LigA [Spirochaetales bacterium]MCF7937086.1 NAD-dependent DNA ligase LigA [Spirochaetales bacterium]
MKNSQGGADAADRNSNRHPKEEMDRLAGLLRRYQHEYYVLSAPSVSDEEYDRLFERLKYLESEYPEYARPDSPSQRVGSDLMHELPEVEHSIPVLSLDKAYTDEGVLSWMEKTAGAAGEPVTFLAEEKIDGVSIVLYYEDGVLQRAVTRGNGYVGNDVTPNVKTIGAVPLSLHKVSDLTVRGEIYLPKDRFQDINSRMPEPFANPRNLASGTLRRVRSVETARVPLTMFAYEGIFPDQEETHDRVLTRLEELGFRVNPRFRLFRIDPADPSASGSDWEEFKAFLKQENEERDSLTYEIDGLVIKVNELAPRERLGYTSHHPRWAVAYKFESPQGITRVRDIEVQIGRTGRATPVARVEPVSIGGSTITNVTLHNQEYISALELSIGDQVAVSRRGDVIPAVERVIEKDAGSPPVWKMPENCPSCGRKLQQKGAHHFCVNPDCPAIRFGRLRFFAAKGQMDIDNLGPETVNTLFEMGLVEDIADFYRADYSQLLGQEGFGPKKVELIKRGVEKSKQRSFRTVLTALGISDLGENVADLLISGGFSSMEGLLEAADRDDRDALSAIAGIGPKMAEGILSSLRDRRLREQISALAEAGISMSAEEDRRKAAGEASGGEESGQDLPRIFEGQTWCVTGSFESFTPREEAMEEVKKRGGRVVSSVTGKTTHLLAGSGAGSKLEKARSLGVSVVDEAEFLRLLGRGESENKAERQ